MTFQTDVQVRFADVDLAGIVFYPRYFEMLNGAVEDWFMQELGFSFKAMHQKLRIGVPTVRLEVDLLSPSELGDRLTISITLDEVGRSSCGISALFSGDNRDRLRAQVVLVCMDLNAQRAVPWPDELKARMEMQRANA